MGKWVGGGGVQMEGTAHGEEGGMGVVVTQK